jgi:signal transduction histidine kinase
LQKLLLFEKNYLNKDNVDIIINKEVNGKQIIQTDEEKIRKILMVLSNNAIKFTKNGHIKLGYSINNSDIQFFIEDTGIGIPEKNQKMIFESFRQVDSSMERNYEGVGIGLTIAKAFVEILDGKIWFDSEENLGTTFYFTVPLIS